MRSLLLAASAVLLAACGAAGGGASAMIKKCVDDGEDRKTCTCMVTEMEKTLDKEVFGAMVLQAEGKEDEAQKIMSNLPLNKQLGAATGMMGVMGKCAGQQ